MRLSRYFGIFVASLALMSCSLMYDHCGDDSDCNAAIGERCLGRDDNTKQKVCILPERECDSDSWRLCPASCQQDDSGQLIEHCLDTGRWGGCFGSEAKLSCPVGFLLYNFSLARVSQEIDEVVEGQRSDYTCVAMQKEEIQAAMQEREEAVQAKTLEPFQGVCLDKGRKSFAVLNVHCCAALNAYEDRSAIKSIEVDEVLKQCAETHSKRKEIDTKNYRQEPTHTACFATPIKADSEEQNKEPYQFISQKKLEVRLSQDQFLNCIDKLQQGIDESFDSTTDPARVIYNDALVYTYQNSGTSCDAQNYDATTMDMVPLAFKDPAIPEPKCSDFIEETTLTLLDFARIENADAERKRVECDSLSQCEPRDGYLYLSRLAHLAKVEAPEGNAMTAVSTGGIVKCDPLAPNILKELALCSSFYKIINDDANLTDWSKITGNSCYLSLSKLVDGFFQYCPVSTQYSDDYDKTACASYLKSTIKNQALACSVYGISCVSRPNEHCLRPVLDTQDSSTVDKDWGTLCYFDKYGLSDEPSVASLKDDLWAYLSSCEGEGMSTARPVYKWTDATKMSMLQKCFQTNSECDILESPSDAAAFDNSLGSEKPRSLYTRCDDVKDSYLLCEKRDEKIDLVCSELLPGVSSDPLDCDGEHISILTEEGLSLTDTDFLELTNMDPSKLRFFDAKPYQTSSAKGFVIVLAYETSKEPYKKDNTPVTFLSAPEEVQFSDSSKTYQAGKAYILLTKFDEEDALQVVGFSTFSHRLDLPMLYIGETTLDAEQDRFLELSNVGSYMPRQPKLNVFVADDHLEVDVFYIADRPLEGDESSKGERQLFIDTKSESQMEATPLGTEGIKPFQAYLTLDSPTLYVQRFEITDDQIVTKTSNPTVLETKFEGGKCDISEIVCTEETSMVHKFIPACAKLARLVCTDRYLDDVLDFDLRGTGLEARVNAVRGLEGFEHVETITYGVDEDKYALQTESRSYDINGNYKNDGNCLTAAESAIPLQLGTTWRFLNRDYIVGFMSQAKSLNDIEKTMITLQEGNKITSDGVCEGGAKLEERPPMAAWRYDASKRYYPPRWESAKPIFAIDHRFMRTASSGKLCSRWVSAWMGQEETDDAAKTTVYLSSMLACLADPKVEKEVISLQDVFSNSVDLGVSVQNIEDMTVTVLTPSRLSSVPRILVRSQSKTESGPRMTHFSLFELNVKDETLQWTLKTSPASLGGEMNGFSKWFKRDGFVLDGSKLNYIRLGCRNTAP